MGGGRDILFDHRMHKEGFDLRRAHFAGVMLAVEQDVAADPVHVRVFSADGVVFEADGLAHHIGELLLRRLGGRGFWGADRSSR